MSFAKAEKYVLLVPPQIKDNGAPAGLTNIDTQGYSHLRCIIMLGVIDADMSAKPKMQESDTTGGSYTDITGAALANTPADGDDDEINIIDIDLNYAHKRYIKCLLTAGNGTTGTNLTVLGKLSNPESGAKSGSASQSNVNELVAV